MYQIDGKRDTRGVTQGRERFSEAGETTGGFLEEALSRVLSDDKTQFIPIDAKVIPWVLVTHSSYVLERHREPLGTDLVLRGSVCRYPIAVCSADSLTPSSWPAAP